MVLSQPKSPQPKSTQTDWAIPLAGGILAIASIIGPLIGIASIQSMVRLPEMGKTLEPGFGFTQPAKLDPVQVNRSKPLQPFFPGIETVEREVTIALRRREAMRTQAIARFIEINAAQGDTGEDIQQAYAEQVAGSLLAGD